MVTRFSVLSLFMLATYCKRPGQIFLNDFSWNWPIRRQRQHGGSGDHSIVAELCGLSRRGGTRKTTLSCARTVAISLPCYSGSNATTYVVSR